LMDFVETENHTTVKSVNAPNKLVTNKFSSFLNIRQFLQAKIEQ
jgi:ribosomal protein L33